MDAKMSHQISDPASSCRNAGRSAGRKTQRGWALLAALAILLAGLSTPVLSQVSPATTPSPVEAYYVPLPETDLLGSFQAIAIPTAEAEAPIDTLISIAIAVDNTIIWYDHWEDGYEADVRTSAQDSTEIWGDGDLDNGAAPGVTTDADDVLQGGIPVVLENTVALPRSAAVLRYDGRDKIQASFPIAVTRSAYPVTPGSVLAGAVEVLSTESRSWATDFAVPVGPSTPNLSGTDPFEYSTLYIMAQRADTQVFLNSVSQGTLGEGENLTLAVDQGDRLTSSKPVQVSLVTGDVDSRYEMRWYTLSAIGCCGNDYYTPVGESNGPTQVWIYNVASDPITVSYDFEGGATPDGTIGPIATGAVALSPVVPNGSGARFWTLDGAPFVALSQTDTDGGPFASGSVSDWGFPLLVSNTLSNQVLVGQGRGNTSNDSSIASRSVVWVVPIAPAVIYVDYDSDGTVDNTYRFSE
ncbi:MAG TPA: hypothetical protein DDY14_13670, partial [Chromatiaceae bacterium]|nr:hypothetical protein [Chromatiaceae bacterium]